MSDRFQITPQIAAVLIDNGSSYKLKREAGIYEAIACANFEIGDELYCRVSIPDNDKSGLIREIGFTLTHGSDFHFAKLIADFFQEVNEHLQVMKIKFLSVSVMRVERRVLTK